MVLPTWTLETATDFSFHSLVLRHGYHSVRSFRDRFTEGLGGHSKVDTAAQSQERNPDLERIVYIRIRERLAFDNMAGRSTAMSNRKSIVCGDARQAEN